MTGKVFVSAPPFDRNIIHSLFSKNNEKQKTKQKERNKQQQKNVALEIMKQS